MKGFEHTLDLRVESEDGNVPSAVLVQQAFGPERWSGVYDHFRSETPRLLNGRTGDESEVVTQIRDPVAANQYHVPGR